MELSSKARLVVLLSPLVALCLIWVSGRQGATLGAFPVFDICIISTFLIQWITFVPAFIHQTEHYFDLSGSLTYIGVVALALIYGADSDPRGIIISVFIILLSLIHI